MATVQRKSFFVGIMISNDPLIILKMNRPEFTAQICGAPESGDKAPGRTVQRVPNCGSRPWPVSGDVAMRLFPDAALQL